MRFHSSLYAAVAAASVLACAAACTVTTEIGPGPDGGAAADGGVGGDGGACAASGSGTVVVTVTGLPVGVDANVTLKKPDGTSATLTRSETTSSAAGGTYAVEAGRVTAPDPLVRTVYAPTIATGSVCLGNTETKTLEVAYAAMPASNKLWATTSNGTAGGLLGFSSASLAASGAPAPAIARASDIGRVAAFDEDGNLWSAGAGLQRFAAASLGGAGPLTADRTVDADFGCTPAVRALAFDKDGNLWAGSTCQDGFVARFAAADLGASGQRPVVKSVVAKNPAGIAFDDGGNLWIAADGKVTRYDRARLGAPTADAADLSIQVDTPPPVLTSYGVDALAFDKSGNLWATDFAGAKIYQITKAELQGTGTKNIVPGIILDVGVTALPTSLALDEGGGLWTPGIAGSFVRFAPAQLGASGAPSAERIMTPTGLGYAETLVFYPGVGPIASSRP